MELTELRKIDPFEFEEYIATIYQGWGYPCRVTKGQGDYGADIIAENDEEKLAIQVKRYSQKHN